MNRKNRPPDRIWLQYYNEDGFEPSEDDEIIPHLVESREPTWCSDQVNEHDVEYVRKDTVGKLFTACLHALRSYMYGNTSPELAEEVENKIMESLYGGRKLI